MARPHKVWFREATGWWMVKVNGVQTKLARGRENKRQAEEAFYALMAAAAKAPESADARTADVIEAFLRHSRVHLAPDTHRLNRYYCQLFAEACGQIPARDMRPFHVARWVDPKVAAGEWGETTVYNARKAAFRVFSWAAQQGLLASNPLAGMPRPKPSPRRRAITDAEFRALYEYAGGPLKDLLLALYHTGARPKEVRELRWDQVREDRWVLERHKTSKKTGAPRQVFLNAEMKALTARLRAEAGAGGHVFLNTEGNPWTMNALRLQVWRLVPRLRPCRSCLILPAAHRA